MRTSVSYNAGLERYFLMTQQVGRQRDDGGHLGLYEAPEPWGPWRTVLFDNAWDLGIQTGSKTVFWNFSNKWLSSSGREFVLVYTGEGPDNWGTVQGLFVTAQCNLPDALDLSGQVVSGAEIFAACVTIFVGDGFTLTPGAAVTLESGETITLGDGFSAEPGAGLETILDPWVGVE